VIADRLVAGEHVRDRMTTGSAALDEVLGGGIPRGSIVFVTGLPGAGKTILSQQALFGNAARSDSVLYVTTLSEPAIKILQFGQNLTFFRPQMLERNVRYADLGSALRQGGTAGVMQALTELIELHRPNFLVLDSFKVFHEHLEDAREFRAFVSDLVLLLVTWEITALLVGEYEFEDIQRQPEFAIADGILHLSGTEESSRQKRYLNVVKMRGTDAFLGRHFYEIDETGIRLYPRAVPGVAGSYPTTEERVPTAITGLSALMGGGPQKGSSILISGGTGSGKTLVALSFAAAVAEQGSPALFVSFEESSEQIIRNGTQLGWNVQALADSGKLAVSHVPGSEVDIDRHAFVLRQQAKELGAQLVVVDAVTAVEAVTTDHVLLREHLWGLVDHFKRHGVTFVLTSEAYSFFETGAGFQTQISYLSDVVILLRLVEKDDDVSRHINVLKMRGLHHDSALKHLRIGPSSVEVVDSVP
jgi:circadian clock protein KaiC